jgi:hypothetical protein
LGVRGADWAPVARPATSAPINSGQSSEDPPLQFEDV